MSFAHIQTLALDHGQPVMASRLLPFSVDGLIAAASLSMLDGARSGRWSATPARHMLALGVLATVAANVAYGARFGPLGMAVSAWPAVAFIGSAELVMHMTRAAQVAEPVAPSVVKDIATPRPTVAQRSPRVVAPRVSEDLA